MKQKIDRQEVYDKYNGHCAYCGKEITLKQMQVDHIVPLYRKYPDHEMEKYGKERGTHSLNNLNPSCARCNKWKGTFSIEEFRREISLQVERLRRDSSAFRMAEDFRTVNVSKNPSVTFFFERKALRAKAISNMRGKFKTLGITVEDLLYGELNIALNDDKNYIPSKYQQK